MYSTEAERQAAKKRSYQRWKSNLTQERQEEIAAYQKRYNKENRPAKKVIDIATKEGRLKLRKQELNRIRYQKRRQELEK